MLSDTSISEEHQSIADATDFSSHPMYRTLHSFWHPVAYASELRAAPLAVKLLGKRLVIARTSAGLTCLDDRCAHRGAALSLGKVVGDCIECPYHGWQYNNSGACTLIPSREELTKQLKGAVPAYHITEKSGLIWVSLKEPVYAPPEFPEFDDDAYRLMEYPTYDWRTSSTRRLENFVDFAHFPFIHDGSIGVRSSPRVEGTTKTWREGPVLRFERSGIKEPNLAWNRELMGVKEDLIDPINEYHVTMPHTVRLIRKFTDTCTYVLFMAVSPTDGKTSRSFTLAARNYARDGAHDALFLSMNDNVLEEDRPVIESQRPAMTPLMPNEAALELPVRGVDGISIDYRRWLLELIRDQSTGHAASSVNH